MTTAAAQTSYYRILNTTSTSVNPEPALQDLSTRLADALEGIVGSRYPTDFIDRVVVVHQLSMVRRLLPGRRVLLGRLPDECGGCLTA